MILTSSKGPTGVLLFGMSCGMVLIALLKKQKIKTSIVLFLSTSFAFVLAYSALLSGTSDGNVAIEPPASVYNSGFGNIVLTIAQEIVFTLFVLIASSSCFFYWSYNGLAHYVYTVWYQKSEDLEPLPLYLTALEYDALEWIRENTPQDSVIATDRHYRFNHKEVEDLPPPEPNDEGRYFYYSTFCERQMFIEGRSYTYRTQEMRDLLSERLEINNQFYVKENENRVEQLNEHEIDYVIVSEFINPDLELDDLILEFENSSMKVYSVPE